MAEVAAKLRPAPARGAVRADFRARSRAGLPTAVTLACADGDSAVGSGWSPAIARPALRPYYSDDVIGAEIGGAVKNVLAIACGVVDGLGWARTRAPR
jgi:glycerol-3-phosphate dehydrogenase (NAD(P)+)